MRVVTIRDVASLSGVSISTVSRVLNGRPDVDAATRERVLAVVQQHGYTQNTNARNLKQRSVDFVAVVVRGRFNFFLTHIAEAILAYGKGCPFQFLLEFIDEKADEFEAARRLYAERRLTGVIFLGSNTIGRGEDIRRLNVPCVFATIEADGMPNVSSVSVDNRACARRAVDALFHLGHRRIAFAGYQGEPGDSIGRRFAGFIDAHTARGLSFDPALFAHADFSMASAHGATQALLARGAPFTGLFAISDTVALGAIKALSESGLRVPLDVSVVGFDGIEVAQFCLPPLTTIRQPADLIARRSVSLMCAALEHGVHEHVTVEAEWLSGGTVRRIGPPVESVSQSGEALAEPTANA